MCDFCPHTAHLPTTTYHLPPPHYHYHHHHLPTHTTPLTLTLPLLSSSHYLSPLPHSSLTQDCGSCVHLVLPLPLRFWFTPHVLACPSICLLPMLCALGFLGHLPFGGGSIVPFCLTAFYFCPVMRKRDTLHPHTGTCKSMMMMENRQGS